MDYQLKFKELQIDKNPAYPRSDIGVAKLFFDLNVDTISFVRESNAWYSYDGSRWREDGGGLGVSELCKDFAQAYAVHAKTVGGGAYNEAPFEEYAVDFHKRTRRESLLSDARSIAPSSLSAFDRDLFLLNCQNGVYDLNSMTFRKHDAADRITKITTVNYVEGAVCERWIRFIDEIMCGNKDNAQFIQKALGYSLTGQTSLECLFILYGPKTRNGKSTLVETVAHLLGDYAMTIQPQTLARRNTNGAAPSPDIARLKGVRFVIMPEPAKGLELDASLTKQFTGGDTCAGRFLFKNVIEFKPEFKVFINTNHLPRISDNTIFISGRIKVIPFERHFSPNEQDQGLKKEFCSPENTSGILNWLIDGYRMFLSEGLAVPENIHIATDEYRHDVTAEIDTFFDEFLVVSPGNRLKTSELHQCHVSWAKKNALHPMTSQEFVGELRRRYEIKRDCNKGNVILGFEIKRESA